jgi:hypothetical protein
MKNILQALILFVLVGFSTNSHSQVILNSNSFEPVFIDFTEYQGPSYTVPEGKSLIITHYANRYIYINGNRLQTISNNSNNSDMIATVHIPVAEGYSVQSIYSGSDYAIIGYLVSNEGFGIGSGIPDDEIIDNGGGGIEIYPNPTDDLASVFVDYQGDWKMTVYDINGQIVLETQSETPVKSIDTNSLSAGTYIVSVRAKRKLIGSSQLIVQ